MPGRNRFFFWDGLRLWRLIKMVMVKCLKESVYTILEKTLLKQIEKSSPPIFCNCSDFSSVVSCCCVELPIFRSPRVSKQSETGSLLYCLTVTIIVYLVAAISVFIKNKASSKCCAGGPGPLDHPGPPEEVCHYFHVCDCIAQLCPETIIICVAEV